MSLRLTISRRDELERWLAWAASAGLVACVLGALYATAAWGSWPAARFLLAYVAPMCVAVPWWLRERLRACSSAESVTPSRFTLDFVVVTLAIARFGIGEVLPFSGHMLFLSYSALTISSSAYRIMAAVLLVETTIFKFVVWQDARSWGIGLALGLVAALVARAGGRRAATP